jgi:mannose-6-phosphate isomerase-like protein (cupin superfamily)
MKASVKKFNLEDEYYFPEGCYITEVSNTEADPELSIARARVEPGVSTRWHCLDGVTERYVILEGTGKVEIEGDIQLVNKGDVVIFPPGYRQRITNTGDISLIFLAICSPRFTQSVYIDLE